MYTYIYRYIQTYIHGHIHIKMYMLSHIYINAYMRAYTHVYARTHTYILTYRCVNACLRGDIHAHQQKLKLRWGCVWGHLAGCVCVRQRHHHRIPHVRHRGHDSRGTPSRCTTGSGSELCCGALFQFLFRGSSTRVFSKSS